jgi:hypothetical protein
MIQDVVNQKVQETPTKFQDNKSREFEKAQEQIKETIEALYENQSETKNTINTEINELRVKIDIKGKKLRIWKTSEKRTKQKCKTQWKANPQDRISRRQNLRIQR